MPDEVMISEHPYLAVLSYEPEQAFQELVHLWQLNETEAHLQATALALHDIATTDPASLMEVTQAAIRAASDKGIAGIDGLYLTLLNYCQMMVTAELRPAASEIVAQGLETIADVLTHLPAPRGGASILLLNVRQKQLVEFDDVERKPLLTLAQILLPQFELEQLFVDEMDPQLPISVMAEIRALRTRMRPPSETTRDFFRLANAAFQVSHYFDWRQEDKTGLIAGLHTNHLPTRLQGGLPRLREGLSAVGYHAAPLPTEFPYQMTVQTIRRYFSSMRGLQLPTFQQPSGPIGMGNLQHLDTYFDLSTNIVADWSQSRLQKPHVNIGFGSPRQAFFQLQSLWLEGRVDEYMRYQSVLLGWIMGSTPNQLLQMTRDTNLFVHDYGPYGIDGIYLTLLNYMQTFYHLNLHRPDFVIALGSEWTGEHRIMMANWQAQAGSILREAQLSILGFTERRFGSHIDSLASAYEILSVRAPTPRNPMPGFLVAEASIMGVISQMIQYHGNVFSQSLFRTLGVSTLIASNQSGAIVGFKDATMPQWMETLLGLDEGIVPLPEAEQLQDIALVMDGADFSNAPSWFSTFSIFQGHFLSSLLLPPGTGTAIGFVDGIFDVIEDPDLPVVEKWAWGTLRVVAATTDLAIDLATASGVGLGISLGLSLGLGAFKTGIDFALISAGHDPLYTSPSTWDKIRFEEQPVVPVSAEANDPDKGHQETIIPMPPIRFPDQPEPPEPPDQPEPPEPPDQPEPPEPPDQPEPPEPPDQPEPPEPPDQPEPPEPEPEPPEPEPEPEPEPPEPEPEPEPEPPAEFDAFPENWVSCPMPPDESDDWQREDRKKWRIFLALQHLGAVDPLPPDEILAIPPPPETYEDVVVYPVDPDLQLAFISAEALRWEVRQMRLLNRIGVIDPIENDIFGPIENSIIRHNLVDLPNQVRSRSEVPAQQSDFQIDMPAHMQLLGEVIREEFANQFGLVDDTID